MTTEAAPTFKPEAIGKSGDPVAFEVDRERIAAYAAATNDPIARARRAASSRRRCSRSSPPSRPPGWRACR